LLEPRALGENAISFLRFTFWIRIHFRSSNRTLVKSLIGSPPRVCKRVVMVKPVLAPGQLKACIEADAGIRIRAVYVDVVQAMDLHLGPPAPGVMGTLEHKIDDQSVVVAS